MKASEKAGLVNENTNRLNFFALEPEAASLYCSQDLKERIINEDYIKPGKIYIICDLGGGTGDIVTHEKSLFNNIYEKYPPIGGNYGSDEIDKQIFNKVIYKIFGFNDYNSLKKKNEEKGFPWKENEVFIEWNNLQYEIQGKKKITEDKKEQFFLVNFGFFQEFTESDIEKLVENYNISCPEGWKISIKNKKRWILSLPYKIFFDLIEDHAKKIIEQLNKVYQKVDNIESIVYVGGYCSNEILFQRIKNEFKELINNLKPTRPEIAVIKGAVLFGLNSDIISVRKAPYTIGFKTTRIWDEDIYGGIGEKTYDPDYNVYRCYNIFHVFIKIGQDISFDDVITHNFTMLGPRYVSLKFYKTLKEKPILCTEEGVEIIGKDELDLGRDYPLNERNLIIKMKFGGTYCEAKCIHTKSGKEIKLPLYFN